MILACVRLLMLAMGRELSLALMSALSGSGQWPNFRLGRRQLYPLSEGRYLAEIGKRRCVRLHAPYFC